MSDRPGALAALARHCGERSVTILGLQIFPGVGGVTDELVRRAPESWTADDVAGLTEEAGGTQLTVGTCTEHVLVDGPIQYLHALRRLAHDPATLEEVLARLVEAEAPSRNADPGVAQDTLVVEVGARRVALRRTMAFTATERARAVAFAEVAAELVPADGAPLGLAYDAASAPSPGSSADVSPGSSAEPVVRLAGFADTPALMRMHQRCSADSAYRRYAAPLTHIDDRFARRLLMTGGGALVATVGDEVVGIASVSTCEAGVSEVAILVEDGWQRRGLGTRLLSSAARLARGHGADDVVLRSRTHNPALMSLAFASGLRARITLDGDTVVVTVGIDGIKPLTMVPSRTVADPGLVTG